MATFQMVKLKDICERIDYGFTASASDFNIGPKFLRITDIAQSSIDWENVPYCKISETEKEKYLLIDGDIVVARTGATTGYAKCLKNPQNAVFASYLVRFRVNKSNDSRFVGHVVESQAYKNFIKNNLGGSAQPQANAQILGSYELSLPDKEIQTRIASVLSAYDDLIENNEKRIKALEEMAQLLYAEWFVKFKFPGREKVKMFDSNTEYGIIPEGWEVKNVESLIKRIQVGKKYENKNVFESGKVPVLDQGKSGFIGYHNDEPGVRASINNPVIVFANHTCYQNIIVYPFSAIQNMLPFIPNDERDIFWLHWATKDLIKFNDYKGHWPEFMSKKFVVPSIKLTKQFGAVAGKYVAMKYKLETENQNLSQTRDLLISQLVTGKREFKQ